jgi:competence protein ComEA
MSRAERNVILLLIGLAVAGHGARLLADRQAAPGEALLPSQLRVASARTQRDSAAESRRRLRPGERIDPNRASAAQLARIPGVGMRLAKEIVADRDLRGVFGSAADLSRVAGIGPATIRRLEPFLLLAGSGPVPVEVLDLNHASEADLDRLPGVGKTRAKAILAYRERNGPFADPSELAKVPGLGRRLAERLARQVTVR